VKPPAHPAEALLGRARSARVRVVAGAALLAAFLAAAHLTSLHERVPVYLEAARGLGARGVLVHAVAYLLAALLALPLAPITVAAGATYGVLAGTVLAVPCVTLGACAAFLVGRLVVARDPDALARGEGKLARAVRAIGRGGFRLVVVLRLAPAVPFSILNFAFGATPTPIAKFAAGSFLGTIPSQLGYAILGAVLAWAPGRARTAAEVALVVAGAVLSVGAVAVAVALLRALARQEG
jgi:uncharacterized membrane protein YdjX (TVP38/TMEM64 family)